MKTIKETEFNTCQCCDDCKGMGYNQALKDVAGFIDEIHTDNKIGIAILKELRKGITG